ncbi:MAG TPA: proline racemase family protein [Acetobacteraceae bacterium]|nr:proline racemase family protein [Acetobacteraceae bacterium]
MQSKARTVATYRTIDMHTAGEPVRIVLDGFPEPKGATVLAKRADAMERLDLHRQRLMLEPRGHADMYGALPVAASAPGAAFGTLFMHHSGFSTMCGHATIALGRWAVDSGRVPLHGGSADFVMECPCGLVDVHVREEGASVAFDSVPGFAAALDLRVDVPGFGDVICDIGYGGAFYAILPATRLGIDLQHDPLERQRMAACAVTDAIRAAQTIRHPAEPDLGFLYGTILTDGAPPEAVSRNLCVFGEGQIDRSPTGSGVTARLAVDATRGLSRPGEKRQFYGPTGVPFGGAVIAEDRLAGMPTFRVRVEGSAFYSGEATFIVEAGDALQDGFDLNAGQEAGHGHG